MLRPALLPPRICLLGLFLWVGCHRSSEGDLPKTRRIVELNQRSVAALVPTSTSRNEWAQAILGALKQVRRTPDRASVCAVIAVIAQESNFQANPVVPVLAQVVKTRLADYEKKYGRAGKALIKSLLNGRALEDNRTFRERLEVVKTERDLDLTFRDMLAYYRLMHPIAFGAANVAEHLWDGRSLQELNPIATAGPMQVNVAFAEQWASDHDTGDKNVRDNLYTITGGVLYGTARLFDHEAAYTEIVYRFADYNAGIYASRNAAFQTQLGRLLGQTLALDGDLLRYDADGEISSDESQSFTALKVFAEQYDKELSNWRVKQDVAHEKRKSFEDTDTYKSVKAAFAKKFKTTPRYAILPQAEIDSPKLRRKRSTGTYATSTQRRYEACVGAGP